MRRLLRGAASSPLTNAGISCWSLTVREGREFLERAYANAARELPREEKLLEKPFCGKSALGKREEHIDIRDSYIDGSKSTKEGVDTGSSKNVSTV